MPRQTESQITGRLGERWFRSRLPPEWLFHPPSEDFGVDGTVSIGEANKVTPLEFGVQVKASKNWRTDEDRIVISGIPVDTVRYWTARLIPTLLVIYDAALDKGYYSWAWDSFAESDLAGTAETVTLKVSTSRLLDSSAWSLLKNDLMSYHARFDEALATTRFLGPVLRSVHTFAECLRSLHVACFIAPETEDQRKTLHLLDAVAHREVVLALEYLASRLPLSSPIRLRLQAAGAAYRSLCCQVYHPFDDLLKSRSTPVLLWANEEMMKKLRPRFVGLVTEAILALTRQQHHGEEEA